ncbi:hypothetical protein CPB84DRAFT_1780264 [Gymnopilus junonius]|uniref:RBR-type E3 ubiquitin transferase n=1 Tax=Gymnopilus junonius TaxID=109634 RepID=A0A9P5NMW7_GYMJU|nr:hypothetical protein CPB84DRAFT_1780264 [Gymnopilus junonius]
MPSHKVLQIRLNFNNIAEAFYAVFMDAKAEIAQAEANSTEYLKQVSLLLAENEMLLARLDEQSMDIEAERNAPQNLDDDVALAAKLQALYDQDQTSKKPTLETFDCGICFETLANDYIVQFEQCHHSYCRNCLMVHVSSALRERRYPILCPSCAAEKAEEAAAIDYDILEIIGATAADVAVFEEVQLGVHSFAIQCQKCKETMFIDRDDYQTNDFIICPLPRCHCMWCKKCLQEVGPLHSCDGMIELDKLMKTQGWKYCPACRTPIQKVSGCNHMVCTARGCKTEFCYRCGKGITTYRHDC